MRSLDLAELPFRHVDVFAEHPFAGNGLVVVFGGVDQPADRLLAVAQELRQFETIFVEPMAAAPGAVRARIFTVEEELPFAGHPVIGAAAALHERSSPVADERRWRFEIADRSIDVTSRRSGDFFTAAMNQGRCARLATVDERRRHEFATALGLADDDLLPLPLPLPVEVLSTGLAYLIVPATARGLERARVAVADLGRRLAAVGADFVYVLDPATPEGRSWNNAGTIEDVATGSAAGPVAAYLEAHTATDSSRAIELRQGRFVGRPSVLTVERLDDGDIYVGGAVAQVSTGTIRLPR